MEPKLEILLRTIVVSIAKHTPNPLIVDIGGSATLTFQVDAEDMGRCVGKRGNTIWGIQSILWYAGLAQFGFPYKVRLVDPPVKIPHIPIPFKFRPDWDRDVIHNLCSEIILSCLPGHSSFYLCERGKTSAIAQVLINKYLERNMEDPSFSEALSNVLRAAGLSHGVNVSTEVVFG